MELTMVKNEENPGRRRLCAAWCVKRRRRDPPPVAVSCDNSQTEQKLPQKLADQTLTTTMKRSSRFRGVSRHRWTGRFEAHLWDKLSWNVTQKKKGKQVYLGAYDEEESAARAYDLAALKYWGAWTFTNFPISDYEKEIEIMQSVTKEEFLASLRRYDLERLSAERLSATRLFLHTNPFASDYLNSPRKQEVTRSSTNLNAGRKSSSPTALGLLLQSSIFRELVQKNSNFSEDDSTDSEEPKNQPQAGSDDEYGGIVYEGTGDNPFDCSSTTDGDNPWNNIASTILLNHPTKANASETLFFVS